MTEKRMRKEKHDKTKITNKQTEITGYKKEKRIKERNREKQQGKRRRED